MPVTHSLSQVMRVKKGTKMDKDTGIQVMMNALARNRIYRAKAVIDGQIISIKSAECSDSVECINALMEYFGEQGHARECTVMHQILETG